MRCLLDTHTLIWLSSDAPNLSERAREMLCAPETELFASLVSLWEMQIKESLGKLDVDIEIEEFWADVLRTYRIEPLDIKSEHILNHRNLPAIHRDPFDRMLVSQAQTEGMTLVTKDQHIPKYAVDVLW
jgi:PIN domain nuclease of toxin-antitoxin system